MITDPQSLLSFTFIFSVLFSWDTGTVSDSDKCFRSDFLLLASDLQSYIELYTSLL